MKCLFKCFARFIELYKYCLYISYIMFCQIYTYEKNALPSHFLTVIQRAVVFNFDKVLFTIFLCLCFTYSIEEFFPCLKAMKIFFCLLLQEFV